MITRGLPVTKIENRLTNKQKSKLVEIYDVSIKEFDIDTFGNRLSFYNENGPFMVPLYVTTNLVEDIESIIDCNLKSNNIGIIYNYDSRVGIFNISTPLDNIKEEFKFY